MYTRVQQQRAPALQPERRIAVLALSVDMRHWSALYWAELTPVALLRCDIRDVNERYRRRSASS